MAKFEQRQFEVLADMFKLIFADMFQMLFLRDKDDDLHIFCEMTITRIEALLYERILSTMKFQNPKFKPHLFIERAEMSDMIDRNKFIDADMRKFFEEDEQITGTDVPAYVERVWFGTNLGEDRILDY